MAKSLSLSSLTSIKGRPKKRLGRGHGSGRVKTSGRGTKGQKARGRIKLEFEGGQLPIIKRLPLLRGKGKNDAPKVKAFAVSLDALNALPKKSEVTVASLKKYNVIDPSVVRVKILANGKIENPMTVRVPCSAGAKKAIEKAGGTVVA